LLDGLDRIGHDPAVLTERAHTQVDLGALYNVTKRPDQAIQALTVALPAIEQLSRADGSAVRAQGLLATYHHNLGQAHLGSRRTTEAEDHFRRAIELNREAVRDDPHDVKRRLRLTETLINLGMLHWQMNQLDRADVELSEAIDLLEAAAHDEQLRADYLYALCGALNNWGNVAASQGRHEVALERFGRGIDRVELALRDEPNLGGLRTVARDLNGARAIVLMGLGRHADAVPDWNRVIDLESEPARRREYRVNRLAALVHTSDYASGIEEAAILIREQPSGDGASAYNLGCVYALASTSAGRDGRLEPEDRQRRARAYANEARAWLRRASAAGFFRDPGNCDHARTDPDLAPLADHAEFLELLKAPSSSRPVSIPQSPTG
jgi:tetratricopeptide (TPR) repeat protein